MDTNKAVLDEQCVADDWELWAFAWEMNWFVDAFQRQFFGKLGGCPTPVVGYATTHAGNLGMYRIKRNAFGLSHEININRSYINRPKWSVLHTLFHEMVHAWEYFALEDDERTKNRWHKAKFCEVMKENGITVNRFGHHVGMDMRGPLSWFLQRHGIDIYQDIESFYGQDYVEVPRFSKAPVARVRAWRCGCDTIKLPLSKEDFDAKCLKCGDVYLPLD